MSSPTGGHWPTNTGTGSGTNGSCKPTSTGTGK